MTPFMRRVHWFAVGAQLIAVALFAWAWVATGEDLFVAWVGWCAFHGALSSHALWSDRKKSPGVRV